MEKPIVTTIVLCDSIMREEVHGKHTLVGVFSSVHAGKFPCYCGALCIFVALTNGKGAVSLELGCLNAASGDHIARQRKLARFADPNQIVEVPFVLRGITFPSPGFYCFELRSENELLAETRCRLLGPGN